MTDGAASDTDLFSMDAFLEALDEEQKAVNEAFKTDMVTTHVMLFHFCFVLFRFLSLCFILFRFCFILFLVPLLPSILLQKAVQLPLLIPDFFRVIPPTILIITIYLPVSPSCPAW